MLRVFDHCGQKVLQKLCPVPVKDNYRYFFQNSAWFKGAKAKVRILIVPATPAADVGCLCRIRAGLPPGPCCRLAFPVPLTILNYVLYFSNLISFGDCPER
jgi:hypothetical protein